MGHKLNLMGGILARLGRLPKANSHILKMCLLGGFFITSLYVASLVHVWTDVRALVYFYNVTDSQSWNDFSSSMSLICNADGNEQVIGNKFLENATGGLRGFPSFSSYSAAPRDISMLRAKFPAPLLVPELGGTGNKGKLVSEAATNFPILLDDLLFRTIFPYTQHVYPDKRETAIATAIAGWLTFGLFVISFLLIYFFSVKRETLLHLLAIAAIVILLQALMTPLTVFPSENPACVPFYVSGFFGYLARAALVTIGIEETCHSFIFSEACAVLVVLFLFSCTTEFSGGNRRLVAFLIIIWRVIIFGVTLLVSYCVLFSRNHYLVDVGVGAMIGGLSFWLYHSFLFLSKMIACTKEKPILKGWSPLIPLNTPSLLMRMVSTLDTD